MKRRAIYKTPVTEILQLPVEDLLNPHTMNPDHGYGDDVPIYEEEPPGDGLGAKEIDFSTPVELGWGEDLWDNNFKSLWD